MWKRLLIVPVAIVSLALSACGSSGASSDPAAVQGKTYATSTITIDGNAQPLALNSTMTVGFVDDGISVNAGCNTMFGPADLANGTVVLSGALAGTKMACEPDLMAQDDAIAAFFATSPRWSLDGEALMLSNDSTMFMLDPAPAP